MPCVGGGRKAHGCARLIRHMEGIWHHSHGSVEMAETLALQLQKHLAISEHVTFDTNFCPPIAMLEYLVEVEVEPPIVIHSFSRLIWHMEGMGQHSHGPEMAATMALQLK